MKKAMKWVIALAVLVACGFGLWKVGEMWEKYDQEKKLEQSTVKEALENAENGTTYVYSDEEIATFKEEATKIMNKEVEEFDLQYGEGKIPKLQKEYEISDFLKSLVTKGEWTEAEAYQTIENVKLNANYTNNDLSNSRYAIYSSASKAEDIFNKDLSLKDAYAFYGYTSVNKPSVDALRKSPYLSKEFNYFVTALKIFDEKHKDNSVKKVVEKLVDYDEAFIKARENPQIRIGALQALHQQWESENKENSMNPLQRLLRVEKLEYIEENLGHIYFTRLSEKDYVEYDPFPSEYNYWETNEAEYFTVFYPKTVTKLNDLTYIIEINTEKPVDRYGATIIAQNIQCRFAKNMEVQYTGEELFKVIVKVNDEIFHDMNSGIVMTDVVNGMNVWNKDNIVYVYSENTQLPQWHAWTPNDEARPWVDAYFSAAAKAYEEDSYFSIFETIEQVAEEFDVNYEDVENVIMSCYFIYNGYNVWLYDEDLLK